MRRMRESHGHVHRATTLCALCARERDCVRVFCVPLRISVMLMKKQGADTEYYRAVMASLAAFL